MRKFSKSKIAAPAERILSVNACEIDAGNLKPLLIDRLGAAELHRVRKLTDALNREVKKQLRYLAFVKST